MACQDKSEVQFTLELGKATKYNIIKPKHDWESRELHLYVSDVTYYIFSEVIIGTPFYDNIEGGSYRFKLEDGKRVTIMDGIDSKEVEANLDKKLKMVGLKEDTDIVGFLPGPYCTILTYLWVKNNDEEIDPIGNRELERGWTLITVNGEKIKEQWEYTLNLGYPNNSTHMIASDKEEKDKVGAWGKEKCNNYRCSYVLPNRKSKNGLDVIKFSDVMMTKVYCKLETQFTANLMKIIEYKINKENYLRKLHLFGEGVEYVFEQEPEIVYGRPVYADDEQQLAHLEPIKENESVTSDWHTYSLSPEILAEINSFSNKDRQNFKEHWLEAARHEHSSVASFSKVLVELSAYGAPASLVSAASRALSDEIRHAKIAFALAYAAGSDKYAVGPIRIDASVRTKEQFAIDNYRDAVINEAQSAIQLQKEANQLVQDGKPALASIVNSIAVDEERHAELGNSIDAWI